jgi:hypothetical protein
MKPFSLFESERIFVDRETELDQIWESLLQNVSPKKSRRDKRFLVVTGQRYGAGKSSLGQNLVNWENDHVKRKFAEFKLKNPALKSEEIENAVNVFVDFSVVSTNQTNIYNMESFLSFGLWTKFLTQYFNLTGDQTATAVKFWVDHLSSFDACVSSVRQLCGGRRLLVHCDEASAIEKLSSMLEEKKKKKKKNPAVVKDGGDYNSSLHTFYELWKVLDANMRSENYCFFYITGKSPRLMDLGKKVLHPERLSPGIIKPLYLSSFSSSTIKAIVVSPNSSFAASTDLRAHLRQSDVDIDQFSKWLRTLTAGLPRLVTYAIFFLSENQHLLGDSAFKNEIIGKSPAVVEEKIFANFDGFGAQFSPADENPRLTYLLNSGRLGLLLPMSKSFGKLRLIELVDFYSLFVEPGDPDGLSGRIVVPKYWTRNMPTVIDPDLQYADKGPALERIVETLLCLQLSERWATPQYLAELVPIVAGTSVGTHQILNNCRVHRIGERIYETTTPEKKQRNEVNFANIVVETSPVVVVPVPKSATPDLLLMLPSTTKSPASVVGFEMKNRKRELTAAIINDEINCFSSAVSQLGQDRGVLIVIAPGGVEDKLKGALGQVVKTENDFGLVIPEKICVKIPSANELNVFIGEKLVERLRAMQG